MSKLKPLAVVAFSLIVAVPASAQTRESEPKTLIQNIYGQYIRLKNSAKTPNQYTKGWYSQRIRAKIANLEKVCAKTQDMCWPDADFLVDGQDYDVKGLQVREVSRDGDKATVEAKFRNYTSPLVMTFSMINENGKWVIDEMEAKPTGYTLSEYLKPNN